MNKKTDFFFFFPLKKKTNNNVWIIEELCCAHYYVKVFLIPYFIFWYLTIFQMILIEIFLCIKLFRFYNLNVHNIIMPFVRTKWYSYWGSGDHFILFTCVLGNRRNFFHYVILEKNIQSQIKQMNNVYPRLGIWKYIDIWLCFIPWSVSLINS